MSRSASMLAVPSSKVMERSLAIPPSCNNNSTLLVSNNSMVDAQTLIDADPKNSYNGSSNIKKAVVPTTSEENIIMEEREEILISICDNGLATRRVGHFLQPSVMDINAPALAPTFNPDDDTSGSLPSAKIKAKFHGWGNPQKKWKIWVDRMHCLYQSAWRKAGIEKAILNSTYRINLHEDLILQFAEKWCPDTNTFVFSWGEATITLEDMMELGGYSLLGDSVLSDPTDREMKSMCAKLSDAQIDITRATSRKVCQGAWMDNFIHAKGETEHQAFLAYWLSRYVFLKFARSIRESVFPTAIRLVKGNKIALAPSVLASIYKDLRLLKVALNASRTNRVQNAPEVILSSPLLILQVWIWERFPILQPKIDSLTSCNQTRLARWDDLKIDGGNVLSSIHNAGENFLWRPYAIRTKDNSSSCNIHKEKEEWVPISSSLSPGLETYARCLRVSELVGLEAEYIELYQPHRVAMQFGFDQDIPGHVKRHNTSPLIAWWNYVRPIEDEVLYIPARLFESDVTNRYMRWWNNLKGAQCPKNKSFRDRKKDNIISLAHKFQKESCNNIPSVNIPSKSMMDAESNVRKEVTDNLENQEVEVLKYIAKGKSKISQDSMLDKTYTLEKGSTIQSNQHVLRPDLVGLEENIRHLEKRIFVHKENVSRFEDWETLDNTIRPPPNSQMVGVGDLDKRSNFPSKDASPSSLIHKNSKGLKTLVENQIPEIVDKHAEAKSKRCWENAFGHAINDKEPLSKPVEGRKSCWSSSQEHIAPTDLL